MDPESEVYCTDNKTLCDFCILYGGAGGVKCYEIETETVQDLANLYLAYERACFQNGDCGDARTDEEKDEEDFQEEYARMIQRFFNDDIKFNKTIRQLKRYKTG